MKNLIKLTVLIILFACITNSLRANHLTYEHQSIIAFPFKIKSVLNKELYLTGDLSNSGSPLKFQTKEQALKAGRQIIVISDPNTLQLSQNGKQTMFQLRPEAPVIFRKNAILDDSQQDGTTVKIQDCPNVNGADYKMIKIVQGSFYQTQQSYLFENSSEKAQFVNVKNNIPERQSLNVCFQFQKVL